MHDRPVTDLVIIGGGPIGLFAAFYAGMRRMSVNIVDSLDVLGGQLVTLYPEKYIYDAAGFPKILAKDLAANLVTQGLQYGAQAFVGQQVQNLEYDEGARLYTIVTDPDRHVTRAVLVAAGVGAFEAKTLPLPNAEEYEGRGLYYFVKRLSDFQDKRVLIVGGGDSAVDWANALAPLAGSVTLIHRRDQFRAHEESVARMKRSAARLMLFHELSAIGGQGKIEWATVFDNRTNVEQRLEVDAVLVNIGFQNSLGPIKDWGLTLNKGQIVVDSHMQSSRPGIFAAGDICHYDGKLKLIATGFGEATIAVNYAKTYIDPAAKLFPGHSSEMKR